MSKETGGPAFARPVSEGSEQFRNSAEEFAPQDGMTLRDYFAAKAMVRLTGADPDGVHSADTLAALSYRLADAMIKARAA